MRRGIAKGALKGSYKQLVKSKAGKTDSTEFLFGDKLNEEFKDIGEAIKMTKTMTQLGWNLQSPAKNFSGPRLQTPQQPRGAYSQRRGQRRPRRQAFPQSRQQRPQSPQGPPQGGQQF